MFIYSNLFVCISFFIVTQSQEWVINDDGCRTPDGGVGNCVPIRQCRAVVQALLQVKPPISQKVIQQFNAYVCSFRDNQTHVCCPSDWAIDDDGCRTPDGGVGDCIPIRQCRAVVQALLQVKRPVSQRVTQQLNAYVCSFRNNQNHVCCPSGPIVLQDDSPTTPTVSVTPSQEFQTPPDVSNHPKRLLLPDDCGNLDLGDKIRNGKNALLNEFPWMALLSYNTRQGPRFSCGGTIINSRYILTAAHCIKNTESPLLGVRIGEYDISKPDDCETQLNGVTKCTKGIQDLAIEEVIPHPQYNPTYITNDIGLIRTSPMNLVVENARPVCLPLGEAKDHVLKRVTVTGWGVTDVLTGTTSNILQKVDLPVTDLERCKQVYQNQSRAQLTYKQVCAGGKNKQDSCAGDSGGPLHVATTVNDNVRYVQQGIVSFGPRECGLDGFPGVYTRVAYYMDWILDNLKI